MYSYETFLRLKNQKNSCNDKVNRKQLTKDHKLIFWSNLSYAMTEKEHYLQASSNIYYSVQCPVECFEYMGPSLLLVKLGYFKDVRSHVLRTFLDRSSIFKILHHI